MNVAGKLDDLIFLLVPAGIVSIIVLVIVLGWWSARRRRQGLQALAEEWGFTFHAHPDPESIRAVRNFKLFSKGRREGARNLLTKVTDETDAKIFDWRFTTGSGKNAKTHQTTVIAIRSPQLKLPRFLCRPETLLDWIGLTFDGQDIDFTDYPKFSKKYHLSGFPEQEVHTLFHVEVIELLESLDARFIEGQGEYLICYQPSVLIPAKDLQRRFQEAFSLSVLLKTGQSTDH